jgi:uncharacterized membrane protein YeaQ/YmgE (transglycosylase-associated protein family)
MPEGRPRAAMNRRELIMGIIIWLIIGGICGWLASMIMRTDGQQGIILNVVVGIVGSVIANFIFNKEGLNGAARRSGLARGGQPGSSRVGPLNQS